MADPAAPLIVLIPGVHLLTVLLSLTWALLSTRKPSLWPSIAGCGVAATAAIGLLFQVSTSPDGSAGPVRLFDWASLGGVFPLAVSIELQAGRLSCLLLSVVNLVAVGVTMQAAARADSRSAWRAPVASLQLFATSMLLLVSNFLAILLFWQLAAVAGFLLLRSPPDASGNATDTADSNQSTAINRVVLTWMVADVPLAMGVFLIWLAFGSLDGAAVMGDGDRLAEVLQRNPALITVICFCLLAAAVGRCAQFPLLGWLEDSARLSHWPNALLQTATLMPGAVYLLFFAQPLFVFSLDACLLTSLLGAITALLAAWIAASQNHAPAALSYSTVSHLGLIFAALGSGTSLALDAAAFHLAAHSLIKAALFVTAAILLRRAARTETSSRSTPDTRLAYTIFFAGALLLCCGLLGQNAILMSLREPQQRVEATVLPTIVDWLCTISIGVQAMAVFRTLFLLLSVRAAEAAAAEGAKDVPRGDAASPTAIENVAAALLLLGGAVAVPWAFYQFRFGNLDFLLPETETAGLNLGVVLLVVVCTQMFYARPRQLPIGLRGAVEPFGRLGRDLFHLDEIFSLAVAGPVRAIAQVCRFADQSVLGRLVGGFPGRIPQLVALAAKPMQNEAVQFYVLSLLIATTSLLAVLLWFQG